MAFAALLKSSGTTLMTTVAITAIGFITSVITARTLGPEGRGLLSGTLLIATLAANISLFGLANSFVYHKGAGRPFNYRSFMAVSLLIIMIFSALLSLLGLQITSETRLHEQIPIILCLTAATAAQGYFYALSQLHHELRFFNLMRFLLVIGNLAFLLVLLLAYEVVDFRQILITQLIVTAGVAFSGIVWAKKHKVWEGADISKPSATMKSVLGYGISHHGTVVLGLVLVNFDKIALLHMGTIVEYGFYALAFTTSRLIGAVQESISTALYSRFAGKDVTELSYYVRMAFRLTFLPMLVLAVIGSALSPWLITWVYGDSFAPMTTPFAVLLFECVISGASWTLAQRFNAAGRPGLVFIRQFISVLPVFLALPFLPEHDTHVYLSVLMLIGAALRLSVTMGIYPMVLKESVPEIIPTGADCKAIFNRMAKRRLGQA